MGELSRSEARVAYLVQGGMTEEAARKQAQKEALQDMLYAGLTAAASTGASNVVSGAAGAVVGKITGDNTGNTSTETPQDAPSAEETTAEEAAAGTEPNAVNAEPEAPTPEVESVTPALPEGYVARTTDALLAAARSGDAASRTATVAAALNGVTLPDTNYDLGKSAAIALETEYGADGARAVADIMSAAGDTVVADLPRALAVAALAPESSAAGVLARVVTSGVQSVQDVNELRVAAAQDMQTPATVSAMRTAALDADVANRVKQAVANGELTKATSGAAATLDNTSAAYADARRAWDTADKTLQSARERLAEAQKAYDAQPANTELAESVIAALDAKRQQQKTADKAGENLQKAKSRYTAAQEAYNAAAQTALNQIRTRVLADAKADMQAPVQMVEPDVVSTDIPVGLADADSVAPTASIAAEGAAPNAGTPMESLTIELEPQSGQPTEPMPANSPGFEQWRAERAAKYGTIPQGEKTNRDPQMPKRTSDDLKLSQYVRTFMESDAYNAENAQAVQQAVMEGEFDHYVATDDAAREYAANMMAGGVEAAQNAWQAALEKRGGVSKNTFALGISLLRHAAAQGDAAGVTQMLSEMASILTTAGQLAQAVHMLKSAGPAGRMYTVKRELDKINRQIAGLRKKFAPIELSDKAAQQLLQAKTDEETDAAYQRIIQECAPQVPRTLRAQLDAIRMWAMLSNPRTNNMNILGNLVFMPSVKMKQLIQEGLERVIPGAERTVAAKVDKKYKDFAAQDYEKMSKVLAGKTSTGLAAAIREQAPTFNPDNWLGRWANQVTRKKSEKLEKGDEWFLNRYYRSALAQWLQANNVDLDSMNDATLAKARAHAVSEAQKYTYRDFSALAKWLQNAPTDADSWLERTAATVAVEGILPFKRTPINLLRRGLEYSPFGLIKYVHEGLRNGWTSSQAIDALASTGVGTASLGVGIALSLAGILKVHSGNEAEDEFRELLGGQNYSIELSFGGETYPFTMDWLGSAGMSLFMGAEIGNMLMADDEGITFADVATASTRITEPVFNLTVLDGISDALDSVQGSGIHAIGDLTTHMLTNYASQYVPAVVGAAARTLDPYRRMTYSDANSEVPSDIQYWLNKMQNRIPGLSFFNQPWVNVWGETDTAPLWQRLAENFLGPGYMSKVEADEVETALYELYERAKAEGIEGAANVLPVRAAKSFSAGGETVNLTEQQYHDFAVQRGQMMHSILEEMANTPAFAALSTKQQLGAVQDVDEYVTSLCKQEIAPAYELNDWMYEASRSEQPVKAILQRREELEAKEARTGAYDTLGDAVLNGDAEEALTALAFLQEAGVKNNSIRDAVATRVDRAYKAHIDAGELGDAGDLASFLLDLGIGFKQSDFDKWAEVTTYEG
jgi:hypothetical protein